MSPVALARGALLVATLCGLLLYAWHRRRMLRQQRAAEKAAGKGLSKPLLMRGHRQQSYTTPSSAAVAPAYGAAPSWASGGAPAMPQAPPQTPAADDTDDDDSTDDDDGPVEPVINVKKWGDQTEKWGEMPD